MYTPTLFFRMLLVHETDSCVAKCGWFLFPSFVPLVLVVRLSLRLSFKAVTRSLTAVVSIIEIRDNL